MLVVQNSYTMVCLDVLEILAVFSEENCALKLLIELANMFSAPYCATMIQTEFHKLFIGRA